MHAVTPQPERLGQFEIVDTLTVGVMGPIYRAFDPLSQRSVVLKTVPKTLLESYGAPVVARFQNEARAATCLQHPGIVSVYGYGEDSGLAFIIMEYVDGRELKAPVRAALPDATSLVVQLLDALDYAHDQGVVHRNLKPSNLFLTKTGEVRIADFGVARLDSGTPHYRSPEQFMGLPIDRRSDIFSVGVIFYELLTGVDPFAGTPKHLVDRVCNDKERPPSAVNPDLPRLFDPVCAKALAKAVYDRYPTARAFSDDVRRAFEAACHASVSRSVSSETLVALTAPGIPAKVAPSAGLRSDGKSELPLTGAPLMWDESTLRKVERQLANFIGPLARIIVKEAASRTTDLERLYTLVAESLKNEEDRNAFLAHRFEVIKGSAQGDPIRAPLPAPSPVAPAPIPPIERVHAAEPKPIRKPEIKPVVRPSAQPPTKPNAELEVKAGVRPDPKPPGKIDPKKGSGVSPDSAAALEALLGKQPANLAGYLQDNPAQLEQLIHPFVASVEALIAARTANYKNLALVPQNICFDRLGKATIQVSQSAVAHGTSDAVGKPRYAVPEIFAEKASVDDSTMTAAHIYALGVMFYEILLGRKLFEKTFAAQRTDLDWLRWHADLEAKAPPLKSLVPGCPAALSDLLESMMEKHAEKRPSDMDGILSRLKTIALRANNTIVLHKATPSAKAPAVPAPIPPRRKSRKGLAAVLLILTLALGAGGFFVWQNPDLLHEVLSLFYHPAQTP